MYHEHVSYHALKPLIKFFQKYNLEIFDFDLVEAQGGSIRVYVSKKGSQLVKKKKIYNQIQKEKKMNLFKIKTFLKYHNRIKQKKIELSKILTRIKKNKEKIVGFGAPAKLTTFSYVFGIKKSIVEFIIDDNSLKQNTFSPGKKKFQLKIMNTLKRINGMLLLFSLGIFQSIIKRLKRDFKNKKIIVPFPNPKIIKI